MGKNVLGYFHNKFSQYDQTHIDKSNNAIFQEFSGLNRIFWPLRLGVYTIVGLVALGLGAAGSRQFVHLYADKN